jgi:hypothetical protein
MEEISERNRNNCNQYIELGINGPMGVDGVHAAHEDAA